jgi:hypothetical protein
MPGTVGIGEDDESTIPWPVDMKDDLVRRLTPEEEDLAAKRDELARLESQVGLTKMQPSERRWTKFSHDEWDTILATYKKHQEELDEYLRQKRGDKKMPQ